MNYLTVILVSIALGIDAFSLAISIGLMGIRQREVLIVSGTVTIFHIFMPLLGLTLGLYLGKVAGPTAGLIGALVLIAIGLSAIWKNVRELAESRSGNPANGNSRILLNIRNPISLVLMAASVSLDALTVGFGLGTLKVDLLLTVLTMGVIAGLMTAAGLYFGRILNRTFGEKAEILGGVILVLIGIKLIMP